MPLMSKLILFEKRSFPPKRDNNCNGLSKVISGAINREVSAQTLSLLFDRASYLNCKKVRLALT